MSLKALRLGLVAPMYHRKNLPTRKDRASLEPVLWRQYNHINVCEDFDPVNALATSSITN